MIGAVIPTRYNPPELGALLDVLAVDGVKAFVLRSEDYGHRIYAMWNAGVEMAREAGCRHVAILNDDIEILPGTLDALAEVLDDCSPEAGVVYPDIQARWRSWPLSLMTQPTTGTWGSGGLTGFCFLFRTDKPLPRFDEAYHWWYGDDAWEADVRADGFEVLRVLGVPIRHRPDGSASKDWDRLAPLIAEDRARWEARA